MADNQLLANEVGTAMRALEASVKTNNLGQAIVDASTLHTKLGEVFNAVNDLLARLDEDALDWDEIAGNTAPHGGAHTDSGGTPKGPPGGGGND